MTGKVIESSWEMYMLIPGAGYKSHMHRPILT